MKTNDWPRKSCRSSSAIRVSHQIWHNQLQTEAELAALRKCIQRGCPFGHPDWTMDNATTLQLESTLRPRGRPRRALAEG